MLLKQVEIWSRVSIHTYVNTTFPHFFFLSTFFLSTDVLFGIRVLFVMNFPCGGGFVVMGIANYFCTLESSLPQGTSDIYAAFIRKET